MAGEWIALCMKGSNRSLPVRARGKGRPTRVNMGITISGDVRVERYSFGTCIVQQASSVVLVSSSRLREGVALLYQTSMI